MAKVTLRTGQLKRLGRLSAKNPARAEKVAGRMVERKSRVARGQEYLKKNVGEFMPDVPTVGKKGTKVTKAKKGGSFPDLNKDGKITKADILKGRGVIKNGGKVKTAKVGSKVKKAMDGMTTTLAQRTARAARPAVSPESGRRKTRASLAMNPMMKTGGKAKKMMGGGKCRGGCY